MDHGLVRFGSRRGAAVMLALVPLLVLFFGSRWVAERDPLRRAWRAAQAAGAYEMHGSSRVIGVGPLPIRWWLSGRGDGAGGLELVARKEARADGAPAQRYLLHWPKAELPSPGTEGREDALVEIDPHALAFLLPAGDPLALLAMGQASRPGSLEQVDGRLCQRVDFRVGGRAYASWWADNPEHWPVNADSGGLPRFTAEASLWMQPEDDLPCRIRVRIDLPRVAGELRGLGEMDWRYDDWGVIPRPDSG